MGQSDALPRTPHGQGSVRRQRFGVVPPGLGRAGDDCSFLARGLRHQPTICLPIRVLAERREITLHASRSTPHAPRLQRLPPCRVCLPGSIMAPSTEGGTMTTKTPTQYQHLEPRPGSNYRQLFLKGRRIRAAVVDEAIHGPDPRTPEEFARDYQVPLEAVLEALDYVAQNRPLIEQERDREAAKLRARGFDGPAQG